MSARVMDYSPVIERASQRTGGIRLARCCNDPRLLFHLICTPKRKCTR